MKERFIEEMSKNLDGFAKEILLEKGFSASEFENIKQILLNTAEFSYSEGFNEAKLKYQRGIGSLFRRVFFKKGDCDVLL